MLRDAWLCAERFQEPEGLEFLGWLEYAMKVMLLIPH